MQKCFEQVQTTLNAVNSSRIVNQKGRARWKGGIEASGMGKRKEKRVNKNKETFLSPEQEAFSR
jgi:hypothetical protein